MAIDFLMKKAELVLGGDIRLPEGYDNILFEHRDGNPYFAVLKFGNCLVRKKISEKGEFYLKPSGEYFEIERNDELFLEGVSLKEMFCHSPDLAVINLGREGKVLSTCEALAVLSDYAEKMDLQGISLHGSEPCSKEHYLEVVKAFHEAYPGLNLGIGGSDLTKGEMILFKEVGANNFKSAILSPIERIFRKMDPEKDLQKEVEYLSDAVEIFGMNNVVCTFYVGMGENDDEFLDRIEDMCALGVMPDIKVKKFKGKALEAAEEKLGKIEPVTPERYASLVRKAKDLMQEYSLDPAGYTTMCYGCRLCTLVPFKDF